MGPRPAVATTLTRRSLSVRHGLVAAITASLLAMAAGTAPQDQDGDGGAPRRREATPRQAPASGRDGATVRKVPQDPLPPVKVEPPSVDAGIYPPKGSGTATIQLTNTGDEPLTILTVQTSCSCTAVNDVTNTVIEPGATVTLTVRMEGGSVPAVKRSGVKVLFDGYTRVVEIPVRGETAYPVRMLPGYINATGGENRTGRIVLESVDGEPFRVCSFNGRKPSLRGFDESTDTPRNQYLLEYNLDEFETEDGSLPAFLLIETDRADCPLLDLQVRQDNMRRNAGIRGARDQRISAGQITAGGSTVIDLEFLMAEGLEVSRVESGSPDFTTEIAGQERDQDEKNTMVVHVRVTPREGFTGLLYAPIKTVSNRGSQETTLFGRVVAEDGPTCGGDDAWKAIEPSIVMIPKSEQADRPVRGGSDARSGTPSRERTPAGRTPQGTTPSGTSPSRTR